MCYCVKRSQYYAVCHVRRSQYDAVCQGVMVSQEFCDLLGLEGEDAFLQHVIRNHLPSDKVSYPQ